MPRPPKLASAITRGRLADGVPLGWAGADRVYNVGAVDQGLRRATKEYGLGGNDNHWLRSWSAELALAGAAGTPPLRCQPSDGTTRRPDTDPSDSRSTSRPISRAPLAMRPNRMHPSWGSGRAACSLDTA